MKDQLLQIFLNDVLPLLLTALGAGLVGLLVFGIRWLASKARGSIFEHAVDVASHAAEGAAQRVKTELLPALAKAIREDGDGGRAITPAERAAIIDQGVRILKEAIAPSVLKVLTAVFGSGLDAWLGEKVEGVILAQTTSITIPKPSP